MASTLLGGSWRLAYGIGDVSDFRSIYFFWSYHSAQRGVIDFETSGKNIQRLFDYAKDAGLYVIARPGPYCNVRSQLAVLPVSRLTSHRERPMAEAWPFGALTGVWAL